MHPKAADNCAGPKRPTAKTLAGGPVSYSFTHGGASVSSIVGVPSPVASEGRCNDYQSLMAVQDPDAHDGLATQPSFVRVSSPSAERNPCDGRDPSENGARGLAKRNAAFVIRSWEMAVDGCPYPPAIHKRFNACYQVQIFLPFNSPIRCLLPARYQVCTKQNQSHHQPWPPPPNPGMSPPPSRPRTDSNQFCQSTSPPSKSISTSAPSISMLPNTSVEGSASAHSQGRV